MLATREGGRATLEMHHRSEKRLEAGGAARGSGEASSEAMHPPTAAALALLNVQLRPCHSESPVMRLSQRHSEEIFLHNL